MSYRVLTDQEVRTMKDTMHQIDQAVRAMVRAFAELNEIRARDGVPYTRNGWKASLDQEYFSSVVDDLDEAVKSLTGLSAHLHPELYKDEPPEGLTLDERSALFGLCAIANQMTRTTNQGEVEELGVDMAKVIWRFERVSWNGLLDKLAKGS